MKRDKYVYIYKNKKKFGIIINKVSNARNKNIQGFSELSALNDIKRTIRTRGKNEVKKKHNRFSESVTNINASNASIPEENNSPITKHFVSVVIT